LPPDLGQLASDSRYNARQDIVSVRRNADFDYRRAAATSNEPTRPT
jgi:hypothetical protein